MRTRTRAAVAAALSLCSLTTAGALAATGPAAASTGSSAKPASSVAAQRAALRNGTLGRTSTVVKICASAHLACRAEALGVGTKVARSAKPIGYGPAELATAYQFTNAPAGHGTIAIIDAGAYPKLESDLAVYRKQFGLPACTTASGCLSIHNYQGGAPLKPATTKLGRLIEDFVAVETALDVQMASAACPACKIIELQVPALDAAPDTKAKVNRATGHFGIAVQTAAKLGTDSVSISYGYPTTKYTDHGAPAKALTQRGVAVLASSGDSGFFADVAARWPQNLPTVVSVGGTSLYRSPASPSGFFETAWDGAGSGCSPDLPAALGQPDAVSAQCGGRRTSTDISAVADPTTGVAVYDTYSPFFHDPYKYIVVGGTSASSPLVAGLYARAGTPAGVTGPNKLYAAPASAFTDVTVGQNTPRGVCPLYKIGKKVCTSGAGWDGPTGRGTPRGLAPFQVR